MEVVKSKQVLVDLQIFQGKLAKNEDGSWITANHGMKIFYPSKEWNTFIEMADRIYSKVTLNNVKEEFISNKTKVNGEGKTIPYQEHEYKLIDTPKEIQSIIDTLSDKLAGTIKKPQTEEQKQIKELQDKLNALIDSKATVVEAKEPKVDNSELESVRAEYHSVVGKKPHHKLSIETMQEEINTVKS